MDPNGRISTRSTGQFDPKNWFTEGDGLLASATMARESWTTHRRTFLQTVQVRKAGKRNGASDWSLLTGLPRSSMLLLGYSVEMYLKAGLTKVYRGCSEEMFERDVKTRYRHRLVYLAKEIAFALQGDDEDNLNVLKQMILVDARYPAFVPKGISFSDAANHQTERIWSSSNFEAYTRLANRIQEHSRRIDNRGRDAGYPAPPAQIRAGALTHTAPASGQTSAALSATLPSRTPAWPSSRLCHANPAQRPVRALAR